MAKAASSKDDKKPVLVRFDSEEFDMIETMRKGDIRERTSFIRWLVRQEAERRGIKPRS